MNKTLLKVKTHRFPIIVNIKHMKCFKPAIRAADFYTENALFFKIQKKTVIITVKNYNADG